MYKPTRSSVGIFVAIIGQLKPCVVGSHTPEKVHPKNTIILHRVRESQKQSFVNIRKPSINVVAKVQ
jgi:hypothetical protein